MPPTIKLLKRRDYWETRVKTAYAQAESMKLNFNVFNNNAHFEKMRYENWLEKNNIEPLMDLKSYE